MAPGGGLGLGAVAAACSIGRKDSGLPKGSAALPTRLLQQHSGLCCQGLCWPPAGPGGVWGPTHQGSQGGALSAPSVYGYPSFTWERQTCAAALTLGPDGSRSS